MESKKSYNNVEEMVVDLFGNKEGKKFNKRASKRRYVTRLIVFRCVHSLSRKKIARHIGISKKRLDKIESGKDNGLSIEIVMGYFETFHKKILKNPLQ